MASPSLSKLNALLKKNLLEMKRNTFSTICEIFFPIILMLLLYWLKTIFDIKVYEFEEKENSLNSFIKQRSNSYLDNYSSIDIDEGWNGMSIKPALKLCSPKNKKGEERKAIGIVGVPEQIKQKLIDDSQIFKESIDFSLDESNFIKFESEEEMNDYISDKAYGGNQTSNPLICFGICMKEDKNNHEYDYSLHYFENQWMDGAEDIPKSKFLLDSFQTGPDMKSYEKYQDNGYPYIMKIISDYILSQELGSNDTKINFGMIPMKYKNYREDLFGSFVGYLGPFFIIIAYLGHLCIYVYRMVLEKETKAKEGMKIMGLTDGIYFLSYFIQYTVISFVDSLINSWIFTHLFTRIPYIVFFFIFFLFALNVFALAFFFQSFINKARDSLILSILLYFIMFFTSMLVVSDDATYVMKVLISFFPPVTINLGIILLGQFESHFRKFYLKDTFYVFTNYSILIMFVMLVVDLLFYLFLGYYLQNVLPQDFGVRKPWYFICTKSYWSGRKKSGYLNTKIDFEKANPNEDIYKGNENFQSEDIYKEMINPKDALRIREIVKKFGDGKVAVNHVNLNFYKNEIFALLGHNGAGKTTLISMLTGLYEATEGAAMYDSVNVLLPENIDDFRAKIGICPQHDILFNDLNIKEHLGMFAIFKGVSFSDVDREVNKVIKDFQLEDVQYTMAKNLSAGQRRKLSIAISLIGGSEIIFLDEPSSGMDITSRRNLWEILKRQTDNKIIILTTHYMEEASVLGKRIGIINLGQMKCIGTPLFLIEKFGKFMNITLVKEEGAQNQEICDFINNSVKDAQFESLSEEILVRIPKNNFGKDKGVSLNTFFENLDSNLTALKIKSYSVSMPTLEDVFLNVAQEDEPEKIDTETDSEKKNDATIFDLKYFEDYSLKSKFVSDLKANFIRRIYLTIRDKKGILMEILCPILLVLVGCIISQVEFNLSSPTFVTDDVASIGKQIIYYADINNKVEKENYFLKSYTNVTYKYFEDFNNNIDENTNYPKILEMFVESIYNQTIDTESTADHEIDMNSEDYVGHFGNMLILNDPNNTDTGNTNYEFVELLNTRATQVVPLYTSVFLEQVIKRISSNNVKINYKHVPFGYTAKQEMNKESSSSSTVVLFVAIAFALIPANFISIIVRERVNNSKHLMRLSGMNIYSYWIVNFLFELVKYYFTGGICMLIIYFFDYYKNYLIWFYILYGPPLILMTYAISFAFSDESNAQNKMILLHALVGSLGSTVIMVLRQIKSTKTIGKALEYIFCFLPSFAFNFAYSLLNSKLGVYMIDYEDTWFLFKDDSIMMEKFNLLLGPLILLCIEIVVYLGILVLIEVFTYSNIFAQSQSIPLVNENESRDSGVLREEIRAQKNVKNADLNDKNKELSSEEEVTNLQKNVMNDDNNMEERQEQLIDSGQIQEENPEFMVRVRDLRKVYQPTLYKIFFCCFKGKGKPAVKSLNFCLERGECFGLLGLNGAGKTTTFKCITQEITPTNGEIFLNGRKTNNNFGEIKNQFGYCPQYDAIFEYMTVYENLEFYAKLKGVMQQHIDTLVRAIIFEMRLEEFINKMSGRLSGGNKRKLSVAISMICSPPIILLDEPSTGMDPEARRFMWSVIHKMSTMGNKSSIIMTTHSMDEAETLCKRMGIMVNGEFVCLGKANEIKNKYGYGYELNVRIKPMTEEQEDEMFIKKYNLDKNMKINKSNMEDVLISVQRGDYIYEMSKGRLGEKLMRDMDKNEFITVRALINWIFYVENAIRFMEYGRNNFSRIIIEESMDNNFLFKMKKLENENKSIGYLFGLFEEHKEECFITEYSIQQTSLEQIFNKFAEGQSSQLRERRSTVVLDGDVENIAMSANEKKRFKKGDKIVLNDELIKRLLSNN